MRAYYNEIDPAAAHILTWLIGDGVIADGDVDTRSIADVQPSDLAGYTQAHFFAGGGLWSVAARLAGWSDDRQLWTGSCPCQPFSVAGKGAGENDPRHLWPHFFRLVRACRPPVVMGEQVAGAAGYRWFDGVASDLEREDFACRAVDIPACALDAPHIRQRLYWVAVDDAMRGRHGDAQSEIRAGRICAELSGRAHVDVADAASQRQREPHDDERAVSREDARLGSGRRGERHSVWADAVWLTGADGKARRAKPGVRLLVDGFPQRVASLRVAGNAIVPQVAAEVIGALMDVL